MGWIALAHEFAPRALPCREILLCSAASWSNGTTALISVFRMSLCYHWYIYIYTYIIILVLPIICVTYVTTASNSNDIHRAPHGWRQVACATSDTGGRVHHKICGFGSKATKKNTKKAGTSIWQTFPWNFRVAMWDLALTLLDLVLEDILFSVYSRDGLHGPGFCWF